MSQSTPYRPRHARPDDAPAAPAAPEAATAAFPVIPAQRVAGPLFVPTAESTVPTGPGVPSASTVSSRPGPLPPRPAGPGQEVPVPAARRRRVLPAVLAVVTAALLASGVAIALGGATGADLTTQPVPVVAP